jgi:hypothetical protein
LLEGSEEWPDLPWEELRAVDAEALSGTSGSVEHAASENGLMASTLLQDITVVEVGDVDERLFVRCEQI